MSEASLRAILNQIYRNTHSIIGDPLIDVILFGSYARGDYDEGSDIDIALIVDMDRERGSAIKGLIKSVFLHFFYTLVSARDQKRQIGIREGDTLCTLRF